MPYTQEQLDICRDILAKSAEAMERKEPGAVNSIATLNDALLCLPSSVAELNEDLE